MNSQVALERMWSECRSDLGFNFSLIKTMHLTRASVYSYASCVLHDSDKARG